MINQYDYIKSDSDKLYLRVQNLIKELCIVASVNSNLEAYSYLITILSQVNSNRSEWIKQTEDHILDSYFLNHRCFTHSDKQKMIPIIRQYKLNKLV